MADLSDLRDRMRDFTEQRDWARFHDPKSLVLALAGEVGEVAELFQWLPAQDAARLAGEEPLAGRIRDELADVQLYLIRLADVVGVDLAAAAAAKLTRNTARFPVDDVRSVAPRKYDR